MADILLQKDVKTLQYLLFSKRFDSFQHRIQILNLQLRLDFARQFEFSQNEKNREIDGIIKLSRLNFPGFYV